MKRTMAASDQTRQTFDAFGRNQFIISLLAAAAVIAVLGTVFWVGYQGTDDGSYVDGALAWYRHFPQVGHSHWDLRYPIIFALDLGFWIFGIGELAIGASMLVYLFAVVAVSIWMLQRWFGFRESLLFIAIFCAMPGVIVISTFANAEIPELFYVVVSFACYCAAFESDRPRFLLLCAGLAAGLAFATRETTIGLILAYGLLFLFRPGMRRSDYLLIGLGFAIIILLEMAYFEFEVGNPLWRFTLDVHHDAVDRSGVLGPGQVLDKEGNLDLGGPFSPLLVFFASQKYALIFYAMLCVLPMLLRSAWNSSQRTFLVAGGMLFVSWGGFIIFNVWLLYLVPRYFVVTAWVAAMFAAIGLIRLWREWPRLAGILLLAVMASDAAALYVENIDPSQASRAAIEVALQRHEPVITDAATRRRGRFVAQIMGVGDRIIAGRPKSGFLYVLAPDDLAQCHDVSCGYDPADFSDIHDWTEIARIVPPPRAIGAVLDRLGLTSMIPDQIRKKLIQPNSGVVVYRVR
jgi:4-amino-4-deoxy-L-arabinose transferase-like glycosyltransferase